MNLWIRSVIRGSNGVVDNDFLKCCMLAIFRASQELDYEEIVNSVLILCLSFGRSADSSLEGQEVLQKFLYGAQMSRTDVISSGRRRILLVFSFWV